MNEEDAAYVRWRDLWYPSGNAPPRVVNAVITSRELHLFNFFLYKAGLVSVTPATP